MTVDVSDDSTALVCLNARTQSVSTGLLTFLAELPMQQPISGWRFQLCTVAETRSLHEARNVVANRVLQDPRLDAVWLLEGDLVPEPGLTAMLEVPADIVVGWAPVAMDGRIDPSPLMGPLARSHFGPVRGSNLFVHRRVLEDGRMRLHPEFRGPDGELHRLGDDDPPAIFRRVEAANGRPLVSPEVDFCRRATALGYTCAFCDDARAGRLQSVAVGGRG